MSESFEADETVITNQDEYGYMSAPIIKTDAFQKRRVQEDWTFPWKDFEVALGIENLLELRALDIHTIARATDFFRECGFDVERGEHRKILERYIGEALYFIRHHLFTPDERIFYWVPQEIINIEDPCFLLLYASDRAPRRRYRRMWACSLLKVMYTIANVEFSGRLQLINEAREQIFGRIRNTLITENEKTFIQFKQNKIQLYAIDWKEAKTRTSVIMKLIHKPDNMMEEVFDLMGVRFVVQTENDIPRFLKLLIEADIIIPHQVLGMRSRNSMLNVQKGKRLLDFLYDLLVMDTISPEEFSKMCQRVNWTFEPGDEGSIRRSNIFSSEAYRALQFTVRHLVRTTNPARMVIDSLNRQLNRFRTNQIEDPFISSLVPNELAHYFPLEIQIMDKHSYNVSRFGKASHEQYKASQLKTVRERILGQMLKLTEHRLESQER